MGHATSAAQSRAPIRRRVHRLHERIRQHPDKARFLLSRLLWATGLCRLFVVSFPIGYKMRFHPSSISAGLWRDREFRSEDARFVQNFLRPGETFVDVGANVGQLSLAAARAIAPRGKAIAIEAHPRICGFLRDNARLNGFEIEIHNVAVANRSGEIFFTDFRSDDMNYASPTPTNEAHLRAPVTTLDDILDGRIADLVKVDVEGLEVEVLQGAPRTLASTRCFYIEDYEPNLRRAGATRRQLHSILTSAGFLLFHLEGERLEPASLLNPNTSNLNLIAVRPRDLPDLRSRAGLRAAHQ